MSALRTRLNLCANLNKCAECFIDSFMEISIKGLFLLLAQQRKKAHARRIYLYMEAVISQRLSEYFRDFL